MWMQFLTLFPMKFLMDRKCWAFCMSLIFKFLKIFVFLLCMQALRYNRYWDDNSTPVVWLDNNENYAFTGIYNAAFLTFCLLKKKTVSLYIIQQYTSFPKFWYSFKSSVKAFKPYRCHKLILNNINKMGIFPNSEPCQTFKWRLSQK